MWVCAKIRNFAGVTNLIDYEKNRFCFCGGADGAAGILCSGGGYDQETVDKLLNREDYKHYTVDDYRTMIKQANFVIDDIKKTSDPLQYSRDNFEKCRTLFTIKAILMVNHDFGEFPEEVKPDYMEFLDRYNDLGDKINTIWLNPPTED